MTTDSVPSERAMAQVARRMADDGMFHFDKHDDADYRNLIIANVVKDYLLPALAVERDRQNVCWHCKVVLAYTSKPRCQDCPDECDVEGCDEDGCNQKEGKQ